MNYPTLLLQATGVVLTGDLAVSWPVLVVLAVVVLGWGEARVHIAALREWKRAAEEREEALQIRVASLEVREGRAMERLDYFATRLDRIDGKLDRILDQGRGAA